MSGVVGFSSGANWFIGGWGWRTLIERAIEDASSSEDKAELESSLYSSGLSFEHLSRDDRLRIASLLFESARRVMSRFAQDPGSDEYEQRYVSRLAELIDLLEAERNAASS